jgi:predicted AAA+ superfamily ATPase
MISKNLIKEIILSNRAFILESVAGIVSRAAAEVVAPGKTVIMHGIRRSGKTYILYDIFRRNSDAALYLDFEDDRLTGFTAADFPTVQDAFLEIRPEAAGRIVYLFDEIQHIADWERFCRRVTERESAAVYVTGSSSKLMPLEVDTAIRGRAWSVAVFPFSFPEFRQLRMGKLDNNEILYGTGKLETKKLFAEYAKWGGFPETALAVDPVDKTKLLKEYLRAMFFRDLVERYGMTNIALFDALADKLFSSFSTRLSLTAFYRQYKDLFPFSKDLLFQYFHNFEESMLIFAVRKFSESSYKRSRNPVKIYPADTGLCRRVASEDAGRILENVVFIELVRRGREVYYFEEKQECDFIVKDGEARLAAFQVCQELTDENRRRETGGLLAACKRLLLTDGMILTDDQEWEEEAEGVKIRVLPVWRWLVK